MSTESLPASARLSLTFDLTKEVKGASFKYNTQTDALQASSGYDLEHDIPVSGHSLGQHLSHQPVSLLSLHLQLLRPLSDQILQVGGVLFQHAKHRVDDVGLLPLGDVLELSHEKEGKGMSSPTCYFH